MIRQSSGKLDAFNERKGIKWSDSHHLIDVTTTEVGEDNKGFIIDARLMHTLLKQVIKMPLDELKAMACDIINTSASFKSMKEQLDDMFYIHDIVNHPNMVAYEAAVNNEYSHERNVGVNSKIHNDTFGGGNIKREPIVGPEYTTDD